MPKNTLKAYAVLAGLVTLGTLVGALATPWLGVILVAVATYMGVVFANRFASLSLAGVVAAVAAITIVAPGLTAWWVLSTIAESAPDAQTSGPVLELSGWLLVPVLVAIVTHQIQSEA